jgi:hypothetical protein
MLLFKLSNRLLGTIVAFCSFIKNLNYERCFSVQGFNKIEHYCAYQERCHDEVVQKLRTMKMDADEIDTIIVKLIQDNFLNESLCMQFC